MKQSPDELVRLLKEAVTVKEDNNTLPSLPAFWQEGFAQVGGLRKFMERVLVAWDNAKPGSQIEARFAEYFMEGIKQLQDRGMLGDAGDVEALSDAEVDEEIDRLITQAAQHLVEA